MHFWVETQVNCEFAIVWSIVQGCSGCVLRLKKCKMPLQNCVGCKPSFVLWGEGFREVDPFCYLGSDTLPIGCISDEVLPKTWLTLNKFKTRFIDQRSSYHCSDVIGLAGRPRSRRWGKVWQDSRDLNDIFIVPVRNAGRVVLPKLRLGARHWAVAVSQSNWQWMSGERCRVLRILQMDPLDTCGSSRH